MSKIVTQGSVVTAGNGGSFVCLDFFSIFNRAKVLIVNVTVTVGPYLSSYLGLLLSCVISTALRALSLYMPFHASKKDHIACVFFALRYAMEMPTCNKHMVLNFHSTKPL